MEKNQVNTILVPTDFSDVASNALDHALAVAQTFGNNIALLHVMEEGVLGNIMKKSYDQLVQEAIQMKLDGLVLKCESMGIKATTHQKHGKIYKTIAETATELGCDSIIMGTHGAAGIETFIGSNASRVISVSSVPVIVIKEKSAKKDYKNIVFPLDLTIESKQKVKWAVHLAKYYKSTIHIVTFHESDEFLKNKIEANLHQVEVIFRENQVEYTSKELHDNGNYADQTIAYAEAINADLIMIMTQQETGISEFFMGSYAQQIVNRASSVPVMCCNPRETGFTYEYVG